MFGKDGHHPRSSVLVPIRGVLASVAILALGGCVYSRAPTLPDGGAVRLLIVLNDGIAPGMSAERVSQHQTIVDRIESKLETSFVRSGYQARVISSVEGDTEDFRPGTYLLSIRIRRYAPGSARDRVVGRLFGVGGPDSEDAASLRTAYVLRDERGRLVRSASPFSSSRRSWQDAVDALCRQTVDEVSRAIREIHS